MLIRSQDKTSIVNLENVYAIYRVKKQKNNEIYEIDIRCSNSFEETEGMLGTYSTEEKAIKALDMIQEKYGTYMCVENAFEGVQGYYDMPKVFQMPQDSEV